MISAATHDLQRPSRSESSFSTSTERVATGAITPTGTVKPDGTIHFTKTDTSSWIPGDYRVTLSSGERTLVSEQFHVRGGEDAVSPNE